MLSLIQLHTHPHTHTHHSEGQHVSLHELPVATQTSTPAWLHTRSCPTPPPAAGLLASCCLCNAVIDDLQAPGHKSVLFPSCLSITTTQRPSSITYLTLLSTRNFSILLQTAHEAAVEEETLKDEEKVAGWREERWMTSWTEGEEEAAAGSPPSSLLLSLFPCPSPFPHMDTLMHGHTRACTVVHLQSRGWSSYHVSSVPVGVI